MLEDKAKLNRIKAKESYDSIVKPDLINVMNDYKRTHPMFDTNFVLNNLLHRIQWGPNYKTFTLNIDQKIITDIDIVMSDPNIEKWILTAYISDNGHLQSYGVSKASLLRYAFSTITGLKPMYNPIDDGYFLCLPFTHNVFVDRITYRIFC